MVKFYTIADKRPDFIEMQFRSMEKYLSGEYDYTVIDNAIDSTPRSIIIKETCERLGVKYVKISLDPTLNNKWYSGNSYVTPNTAHLYPMMWLFKRLIDDDKIFVIDSDMFFLSNTNVSDLSKSALLYMPQYRGDFEYIAPSLLFMSTSKVDNHRNINWDFATPSAGTTDVGGMTRDFLDRNENINKEYFEQYSLYDISYTGDNARVHLILNGNSNYEIIENFKENKLISIKHIGGNSPVDNNRTFSHEISDDKYFEKLYNGYLKIKSMVDFNNLINPLHTGFIRRVGTDDFCILHYQTGSNYANFSTDDYNARKTSLIKGILKIY